MLAKKGKNKRASQTALFSVIFILLFFGVTGFLVFSNWNVNQKRNDLNIKIESLQTQIQALENKKSQLESDASNSQSLDYAEKVARENLDYQKPNEDVVVVKQPATTTTGETVQEKNLWQKIIGKIGF